MPLPLSLTQTLRQSSLLAGNGWRGFFAPFNTPLAVAQSSTTVGPQIYDLEVLAPFSELAPATGWSDLGFIDEFKFTPGSKIGSVNTGYRGATRARYRGEIGEKCSFTFRETSHLATKIATGAQVFNLLKTTSAASLVGPLSSSGTPAIAVASTGYLATGLATGPTAGLPTLFVPAGSGALFPAGTYIVCDQDYAGQSGYVGDSGAYVYPGAVTGVDYIRKTSDYVATVSSVLANVVSGQDALILTKPFVGGGCNPTPGATVYTVPETSPASRGAKVQAISGYTAREGGTYIKEWSAIFVMASVDGDQLMIYYPRLSPDSYQGVKDTTIEGITSIHTTGQMASMEALAFEDPLDGETVVRYTSYYPSTSTLQDIQR